MRGDIQNNGITWRTARAWQGTAAFAVIELLPAHRSTIKKAYLIIDAHTGNLLISKEKPEGLKPTGAFAEIFRKQIPHGVISGHLKENEFEWIEIKSEGKRSFICLEKKPQCVIHLVVESHSLARLSSQGTFTKSILLTREIPKELPTAALHPDLNPSQTNHKAAILPEYREYLPRLKRRAKTIEKSLKKAEGKFPSHSEIKLLEEKIEILKSHLYQIPMGASCFEVDDSTVDAAVKKCDISSENTTSLSESKQVKKAESDSERRELTKLSVDLDPNLSPGGNLDKLYKELKKRKKSQDLGQLQLKKIKEELKEIKDIISAMQAPDAGKINIADILKRFGMSQEQQKKQVHQTSTQQFPEKKESRDKKFREFTGYNQAIFRVSRSSEEGDRLCKSARGNDTWFHVTQGKGSHVILVSKSIKDQSPDPRQLRQGAILALHFSSIRAAYSGEVQVSVRSQIRKPKGLPAGLWLVDRAESLYIRYENNELRLLLGASDDP